MLTTILGFQVGRSTIAVLVCVGRTERVWKRLSCATVFERVHFRTLRRTVRTISDEEVSRRFRVGIFRRAGFRVFCDLGFLDVRVVVSSANESLTKELCNKGAD